METNMNGTDDPKNLVPSTPTEERLTVTMEAAAKMLGVSLRHIERLVAKKTIPVTRLGRKVLISRAYIEGMVNPKMPEPPKGDGGAS